MPNLSMKKIFIAILIVLALSRLDRIIELISRLYQLLYDWLSPLQSTPSHGRVALAALILALIYISIYKIIYDRMGKK